MGIGRCEIIGKAAINCITIFNTNIIKHKFAAQFISLAMFTLTNVHRQGLSTDSRSHFQLIAETCKR